MAVPRTGSGWDKGKTTQGPRKKNTRGGEEVKAGGGNQPRGESGASRARRQVATVNLRGTMKRGTSSVWAGKHRPRGNKQDTAGVNAGKAANGDAGQETRGVAAAVCERQNTVSGKQAAAARPGSSTLCFDVTHRINSTNGQHGFGGCDVLVESIDSVPLFSSTTRKAWLTVCVGSSGTLVFNPYKWFIPDCETSKDI